MTEMPTIERYHPLLVALHWLLAFAILSMLAVGFLVLAQMQNADPRKLDVLELHMAVGMAVLALTIVRFIVRTAMRKPPMARTGSTLADRLAAPAHFSLYLLVVAMVGSGYALGLRVSLPDSVFARTGAPLPSAFDVDPAWRAHRIFAFIFLALIALHVLAVLYHQIVRNDAPLRRMMFGRRRIEGSRHAD